MNIKTLILGAYGTNCYLLWADGSSRCLLIDPGYDPERILKEVQALGLTVEAILLTHGHFDHVGAVQPLAERTGCQVYLCKEDLSQPAEMTAGPLYYTKLYGEGDRLSLAGLDFTVLQTPGHTPGSVTLRFQDALFTGDTLFSGSCGRTDFPGGNIGAMRASLKRLKALPGDFSVYPGHGPASTLSQERLYNPYLGETL